MYWLNSPSALGHESAHDLKVKKAIVVCRMGLKYFLGNWKKLQRVVGLNLLIWCSLKIKKINLKRMFDKSNQCTVRAKHSPNEARFLRHFAFLSSKNYGQHLLDKIWVWQRNNIFLWIVFSNSTTAPSQDKAIGRQLYLLWKAAKFATFSWLNLINRSRLLWTGTITWYGIAIKLL